MDLIIGVGLIGAGFFLAAFLLSIVLFLDWRRSKEARPGILDDDIF